MADWKDYNIQDEPTASTPLNTVTAEYLNGMGGAVKNLENKTSQLEVKISSGYLDANNGEYPRPINDASWYLPNSIIVMEWSAFNVAGSIFTFGKTIVTSNKDGTRVMRVNEINQSRGIDVHLDGQGKIMFDKKTGQNDVRFNYLITSSLNKKGV